VTHHVRAHFDGRVFVPDGPVDVPVGQPLDLEVTPRGQPSTASNGAKPTAEEIQERLRRLRATSGTFEGPVPSDESLRRENLYDDRA
jgi:hypothetical protein